MKLLQIALLFTFVILVAHVAASSNRRNETSVQTEEFQLEIPEKCKKLGFCEDIPNYPKEQAAKAISAITDLSIFQNDKLDSPDITRLVYPKAATVSDGKWHIVLNQDDNPVQTFKVEICNNVITDEITELEAKNKSPELCFGVAVFVSGYEGRCR